jgi:hypothetical protein
MKNKPFYPYLFAISPILFLYAHNIEELRFSQIILPMAISLVFFFLFTWSAGLILKDKAKAGIVTIAFSFLFFNYGNAWEEVNYLAKGLGVGMIGHWVLIPVSLVIWGLISWYIYRSQKKFAVTTIFLNVTAICLILINLFNIAYFKINRAKISGNAATLSQTHLSVPAGNSRPDVYFIILDEYAGFEGIKKLYHYNNDAFAAQLEKRGFYVARQGRANANMTEKCLAATLNMRLVKEGDAPYPMIKNSLVAQIFKKLGYQIIIFPINSEAVFTNSDKVYEFTELWDLSLLKTTMLRFIADNIIESKDYGRYFRERILFIFDTLKRLPQEKGPKFVYAHILCPHAPFVFDKQGEKTDPANYFNFSNRKYYLEQHMYMTQKALEVVDVIMAKSKMPPIIILQSDHGQRGNTGKDRIPVGDLWKDILNTYYMPGMGNKGLFPAFLPVNTFRLIFANYFGLQNL